METLNKEKNTLQTVDRALALISLFATAAKGLSVLDICKQMGITRNTAYAMLNSLVAEDYIERDEVSGRYFIGCRFYERAQCYLNRFPIINIAERHMTRFTREYKPYQVNLNVYKSPMRTVILLVHYSESTPRVSSSFSTWAYASASGKTLLAFMPENKLTHDLEGCDFKPFTPHTVKNREELLAQLEDIRKKDYGIELEEISHFRGCIAAPVRDMSGMATATVSFPMDALSIRKNELTLAREITYLAGEISTELGYSHGLYR
ncbi:MAG: IclR family transcriptional regulator [Synergistaceae bacterium]|nr:IclR family transcriptional regulator [Synergistaceae bacterium]